MDESSVIQNESHAALELSNYDVQYLNRTELLDTHEMLEPLLSPVSPATPEASLSISELSMMENTLLSEQSPSVLPIHQSTPISTPMEIESETTSIKSNKWNGFKLVGDNIDVTVEHRILSLFTTLTLMLLQIVLTFPNIRNTDIASQSVKWIQMYSYHLK